jgi:hypothetical protein
MTDEDDDVREVGQMLHDVDQMRRTLRRNAAVWRDKPRVRPSLTTVAAAVIVAVCIVAAVLYPSP